MEDKLKQMEQYLNNDKPVFIEYKDTINFKTFMKLRKMMQKYQKTKVKDCFEKSDMVGAKFLVEIPCSKCLKKTKQYVTKSKLFECLEDKATVLCESCSLEKEKEELKSREKRHNEQKKAQEEQEKLLHDFWFNPDADKTANYDYIFKHYYDFKTQLQWVINKRSKVNEYVANMPYKKYLTTPYWKFVSQLAKKKAKYKCQLCGSESNLNTHHRTYEHKGYEINNMEDLIVLCQNCHSKFHEVK